MFLPHAHYRCDLQPARSMHRVGCCIERCTVTASLAAAAYAELDIQQNPANAAGWIVYNTTCQIHGHAAGNSTYSTLEPHIIVSRIVYISCTAISMRCKAQPCAVPAHCKALLSCCQRGSSSMQNQALGTHWASCSVAELQCRGATQTSEHHMPDFRASHDSARLWLCLLSWSANNCEHNSILSLKCLVQAQR